MRLRAQTALAFPTALRVQGESLLTNASKVTKNAGRP